MSKEKETITFVEERKWLNTKRHSDNGWISYSVTREYGTDAEFMIADCSRTITLNFSPYNTADWANHAKKLNVLIESLQEFREALGAAWKKEYDSSEDKEVGSLERSIAKALHETNIDDDEDDANSEDPEDWI